MLFVFSSKVVASLWYIMVFIRANVMLNFQ